MGAANR